MVKIVWVISVPWSCVLSVEWGEGVASGNGFSIFTTCSLFSRMTMQRVDNRTHIDYYNHAVTCLINHTSVINRRGLADNAH